MNETLYADRALRDNTADLIKMEFPCENNPLETQFGKLQNTGGVMHCHLGGRMKLYPRKVPPCNSCDCHVLDNDGIDLNGLKAGKGIDKSREFGLFHKCIQGHIEFSAVRVSISGHLLHLVHGEDDRKCSLARQKTLC